MNALHGTRDKRVLVVSEDPEFIHLANTLVGDRARVIGCTGPAQSTCNLETHERCPLAGKSSLAIIDSPGTGEFRSHWKVVGSGEYAEKLQRAHPECPVILSGAPVGAAGPTGEVITATDSRSLLKLLQEFLDLRYPPTIERRRA